MVNKYYSVEILFFLWYNIQWNEAGEIVNILNREFNIDDAREAWEETRAEKIAENLLKDGLSKESVIKNTGLSVERVEKLIKRINRNK